MTTCFAVERARAGRDRLRVDEASVLGHELDAELGEAAAIARVDVVDVRLATAHVLDPVERARLARESDFARERLCFGELRGDPHRLLRHAADVDARAADRVRLQQRHARAVTRGAYRDRDSARARAEYD